MVMSSIATLYKTSKLCLQHPFKKYKIKQKFMFRSIALPEVDTAVLYDYIDLYLKYVCVSDAQQCLSSAIIPPLQEQLQIVQKFGSIMHDIGHVHDLQGVIIKLMITHDDKALETLTEEIQNYNNNIALIRTIIEYANTLPLPSNETYANL
jgi:hypothetical protein